MTVIARFLFALLFLFPVTAQAAPPLIFKAASNDIREQSVLTFLKDSHGLDLSAPLSVATVDLNDDGVAEWIVRQDLPNCEARADCPFYVTGLKDKKPALLGQVHARKIGITDQKSYGVYRLVVYNDQRDDFSYKSYAWEPQRGAFDLP